MKAKRHLIGVMVLVCFFSLNFASAQNTKRTSSALTPVVKQKSQPNVAPMITFSEYPVGTVITTQYSNLGIVFGPGTSAFIADDGAVPTAPVLSGTPTYEGPITGMFVMPGTNTPTTAESFSLDVGYLDYVGSTRVEWYDVNGNSLGYEDNTVTGGSQTFNISGGNIASFKVYELSFDLFDVDNVSFVLSGGGGISGNVCLRDAFAYEWHLNYSSSGGVSTATGTLDLGNGVVWNAWGWWNESSKQIELHAVNPMGDNCNSGSTDSFVYNGYAMNGRFGYGYFGGQGDWSSYCGGDVYATGTWSIISCRYNGLPPFFQKQNGIKPAGAGMAVTLKVSPNPIVNMATITYAVGHNSNVNITIYNYMMQPVKTLVSGLKTAGNYTVSWDGRGANGAKVMPGLYKAVAMVDGKAYSVTMQVVR